MNALQVFNALITKPNFPAFYTPLGADESYGISGFEHTEDGILLLADNTEEALLSHNIASEVAAYSENASVIVSIVGRNYQSKVGGVQVIKGYEEADNWIDLFE